VAHLLAQSRSGTEVGEELASSPRRLREGGQPQSGGDVQIRAIGHTRAAARTNSAMPAPPRLLDRQRVPYPAATVGNRNVRRRRLDRDGKGAEAGGQAAATTVRSICAPPTSGRCHFFSDAVSGASSAVAVRNWSGNESLSIVRNVCAYCSKNGPVV
jgi:hypothetical protein